MTAPVISVCIVTGRRHDLLDLCLASLEAQERPPSYELLVSVDRDAGASSVVLSRFPDAIVQYSRGGYPGAARNPLIAKATGELLLFVDDDVTLRPDMLRRLADLAEARPDCAVFGGPNETPRGSSRFQFVQGAVLASMVGSGPVRRRYGAHPAGEADERSFILCNLAIRRQAMVPFAEDLCCAEENGVLAELHRRDLTMHYDPELVVYHERRATPRGFAAQMFKYGRGRGELMVRDSSSIRPAHIAPPLLVLYLALVPVLAAASAPGAVFLPLAVYAAAAAFGGLKVGFQFSSRRGSAAVTAAALVVVLHVEYGAGILTGLVTRRPARRRRDREGPPAGRTSSAAA